MSSRRTDRISAGEAMIVPFPGVVAPDREFKARNEDIVRNEGLELIVRSWPTLSAELREAMVDAVKEEGL